MNNAINYLIVILILATACSPSKSKEKNISNSTLINLPTNSGSSLPYLMVGADNFLYLSWVEKSTDTTQLLFSKFDGSEWSEAEQIASGTNWFVNWADYPMMSSLKNGTLIAHYFAKNAAGTYSYDVNLVTKSDQDWSDNFIPHDDGTPTEHGFVTMLPLTDSTFQVTWLDGRNTGGGDHSSHTGGAMTLRTAIINSNGSVSEDTELDDRTCDCCQTGGAMTSQGPIIVYRDRSELEIRDISIVRKVNGKWTNPENIASDLWNIAGCPVNGPRADAQGDNLVVAWYSAANSKPMVKVVFSGDAGASFMSPITVDDQMPMGRVDVAMIDERAAVVSWLTMDGKRSVIMARKVNKNGTTESPVIIAETSDSKGSGFPQLAYFKGDFYAAWTSMEEDITQVKMAKISL
ncbi:MAG: hypothetical protein ACJA2C_000743 [Marinoscillum sp.]